jgi:lactate dehydrogenase-like 2-hydroxyacid dehydrogenase
MASLKDVDILVLNRFAPKLRDELAERFTLHDATAAPDKNAFIAGVQGRIRGIATSGHVRTDAAMIAAMPKLEIISSYSAGLDEIDVATALKRGIVVTNTSQALYDDVADVAIGLMLNCLRGFVASDRYLREGKWKSKGMFPLTTKVSGKTMGIIGLGAIGSSIAKRAEAMGMTIAYTTRTKRSGVPWRFVERVQDLAQLADVLVVACPGGEATRRLVNAEVLAALGPQGWLVNIARGSIVDEKALVEALQKGTIAGGGLDVFEDEPNVPEALLPLENVVLFPHLGSGTVETREAMGRTMVDNLISHFSGKGALTPVKSA